jgi:hypothetical protein
MRADSGQNALKTAFAYADAKPARKAADFTGRKDNFLQG